MHSYSLYSVFDCLHSAVRAEEYVDVGVRSCPVKPTYNIQYLPVIFKVNGLASAMNGENDQNYNLNIRRPHSVLAWAIGGNLSTYMSARSAVAVRERFMQPDLGTEIEKFRLIFLQFPLTSEVFTIPMLHRRSSSLIGRGTSFAFLVKTGVIVAGIPVLNVYPVPWIKTGEMVPTFLTFME